MSPKYLFNQMLHLLIPDNSFRRRTRGVAEIFPENGCPNRIPTRDFQELLINLTRSTNTLYIHNCVQFSIQLYTFLFFLRAILNSLPDSQQILTWSISGSSNSLINQSYLLLARSIFLPHSTRNFQVYVWLVCAMRDLARIIAVRWLPDRTVFGFVLGCWVPKDP